tara:strand:- start:51 stop:269 length:219 start_codon:yes stop_codon:yes gene_type:complete
MKKPKDYLENCEYISQDGDTVYIDEEALEACMEDYANQRIIEELELILSIEKETGIIPINALKHRLKVRKQE